MVGNSMDEQPRILILTAGYGEGHNSAARGIAEALEGRAECRVANPCQVAMPGISRLSQAGYRWVINYAPELWRLCFDKSDGVNLRESSLAGLAPVKEALRSMILEFRPQVVISTYMLYPYLLESILDDLELNIPSVVVVTDSMVIHHSWTDCEADLWCVTDDATKQVLVKDRNIPEDRVAVTGFPVSQRVVVESDRVTLPPPEEGFRILYLAQGNNRQVLRDVEAMLKANASVHVTAVLGRRLRSRYVALKDVIERERDRLRVMGWTRRIPALMATHHLVVGKAGGATTHEALVAHRPMIVTHLVPGQEEGNLALLESLDCGRLVTDAGELCDLLRRMLMEECSLWKKMQSRICTERHGSTRVADLALQLASSPSNPSLP